MERRRLTREYRLLCDKEERTRARGRKRIDHGQRIEVEITFGELTLGTAHPFRAERKRAYIAATERFFQIRGFSTEGIFFCGAAL